MSKPIIVDDQIVGAVVIIASIEDIKERIYSYSMVALSILVVSILIALFLSYQFQKLISNPIMHLSEISSKVTDTDDYSARAVKTSNDEIGNLIDNFNKMISQIRERDEQLKKINLELEDRVKHRTKDLEHEIETRRNAESSLLLAQFSVDNSSDTIFRIDKDSNILYANDSACRSLGYSKDEILKFKIADVDPLCTDVVWHECWSMLKNQGSIYHESINRRKDRSTFPIELIANYLQYDGVEYSFIFSRDVTNRKIAEENLKKNLEDLKRKNRYENIINLVTQTLHQSLDLDEILDRAVEAIHTNIDDVGVALIYLVDGSQAELKAHRGLTNNYISRAGRIQRPKGITWKTILDGKPTHVSDADADKTLGEAGRELGFKSYIAVPILTNNEPGGVLSVGAYEKDVFGEDDLTILEIISRQIEFAISNARQTEIIKESEMKFRNIFDYSHDPILIHEINGRIIDVNNKALDKFGFSKEEFLTLGVLDLYPLGNTNEYINLSNEIKDNRYVNQISNMWDKNHNLFPAELSCSLFNIRGKEYVQSIVRDITYRKTIEEEMLKSAKLESIGVLAGGIAHDFNNILTSIMGNMSMVEEFSSSNENISKLLKQMIKGTKRASDLTNQLLTFSRGGDPLIESVSIEDMLGDSVEFALRGSNIQFEMKIESNLPLVQVDQNQISQIINNIIINAKQAMPDGGLIQVSCSSSYIERSSNLPLKDGGYVKVSIQDEGSGIPEKHISRIFDPYFTTKQDGSGLGLATAYSIIKRHEGHISVSSVLGKGTTFDIYLPVSDEIHKVAESKDDKPVKGEGRILIMDDDEHIRDLLNNMLGYLGYQVFTSKDGIEAIDLYIKHFDSGKKFDAVILDLTIPGSMGGWKHLKDWSN